MKKTFTNGIIRENPIFVIMLGLCPTLAVSTSLFNAVGMAAAVIFVLVFSNLVISLIRKFIPDKVRIPCFIVIIATFVTITELFMHAFVPQLFESLGMFVSLIVVNCIILGRAEAFASKNKVSLAVMDGLGMGLGFTLGIAVIALIREILGSGSIWGFKLSLTYKPLLIAILPAGAFLTIGFLIGLINIQKARMQRAGRK